MDNIQKISAFKQVSFSKFLEEADLWYLLSACKDISLKEGEILFEEGSFKESMFVILEGKLEVYRQHKQIAFREVGDFFGEMSILESKPRSASIRAATDSVLLEINKDVFLSYFGSNLKVVWDILKTLSQRNRADLDIIDSGYRKLKQSEENYRGIVESISDLIIKVDPNGIICFANESTLTLGYGIDELIGKPFTEIFDGKLDKKRKHQILTKRVGPRATSNMEISLKVNPDSNLYGLIWNLPFLVNTSGLWDMPQKLVMKKGVEKEFQGSILVARSDKKDLMI